MQHNPTLLFTTITTVLLAGCTAEAETWHAAFVEEYEPHLEDFLLYYTIAANAQGESRWNDMADGLMAGMTSADRMAEISEHYRTQVDGAKGDPLRQSAGSLGAYAEALIDYGVVCAESLEASGEAGWIEECDWYLEDQADFPGAVEEWRELASAY